MKKIFFLLFFVCLFLVSTVSAANWYVSTASSGTASGNSWANKRILSSFNWAAVQPGDTVYIDGGASGLTYNYALNPAASGTASNRIIITRGIEAGHNGVPTFHGVSGVSVAGQFSRSYLTINDIAFEEGNGIPPNTVGTSVYFTSSSNNIDLTNCSIKFTTTKGVELRGDNIRIMYCDLFTGLGSFNAETDGIWMSEGNNAEIAYNSIILQNSDTHSGNHKDIIQANLWQMNGGTTKIHHNLFYQAGSGVMYSAGIYLSPIGGEVDFYDNIVVIGGTSGYAIGWFSEDYQSGNPANPFQAKVYNNIFHIMDSQQGVKFYGADNLVFRNNVIYSPVSSENAKIALSGGTEYLSYPDLDFDYNQYRTISGSSSSFVYLHESNGGTASYSWNQWRNTGQDAHSEIFTSGSSLALTGIVPSTNPSDYALTATSSGVDEGTTVALVTDDYSGRARPQGSAYDVGAFEYGSALTCNPADSNCDQCISLGEISAYVASWLQGSITLGQCSTAVSTWLGGC